MDIEPQRWTLILNNLHYNIMNFLIIYKKKLISLSYNIVKVKGYENAWTQSKSIVVVGGWTLGS